MATKKEIEEWLEEGKEKNATHMIVVCDTYDWEDYPVYVSPKQDVNTVIKGQLQQDTIKIMEVYSYNHDLKKQLAEHRAYHLD